MKTFVLGDIHGRFEALKQVLKLSDFHYKKDKLIFLGDLCDGGKDTFKCVEELLKIKNIVFVRGNHDHWFMKFMNNGWEEEIWIQQGGANTLRSYGAEVIEADYSSDRSLVKTEKLNIPVTHQEFFNRSVFYHEENNMVFVHGGFSWTKDPQYEKHYELMWDRELIRYAQCHPVIHHKIKKPWDKVFVGHSTTQYQGLTQPIKYNNLIMLDCGVGWNGKLCIMDINTEKYWLSDRQQPPL